MNKINQLNIIFNKREKFQIYVYLMLTLINPIIEVLGIGSLVALILFFFDSFGNNFYTFFDNFNFENYRISETFSIQNILYFIILIFLLKAIYLTFYSYYETKIRNLLVADKSKGAFESFINSPYIQIKNTTKSEVFNSSVLESARVIDYVMGIIMLFREIILLIILFLSLLVINILYTSFLFTTLILFFVLIYFLLSKKMYFIGEQLRKLQKNLVDQVNETISSFKVIDILNKKSFFINKFNLTTDIRKTNLFIQQYIKKLPRIIFEAYMVIAICSTILIFYSEDEFNQIISYIAILGLISSRVLPSFTNLNVIYSTIKFNEASIDNYFNKFYLKKKFIFENKENHPLEIDKIHSIKIMDLDFSYQNQKKIIQGLNLEIQMGDVFGIFGRSGSGKSTLVDILSGLIIPEKGKILINNEFNIDNYLDHWKKIVGYVPQAPLILNDSIINNICLGVKNTAIDNSKLNQVISITNLKNLIDEHEKFKNFKVGENGNLLSGGQKQRISIARTLYFNPRVIIFDEATSSLDNQSENEILNLILKLKKDHLIILISHNEKIRKLCSKSINIEDFNAK